MALHITDYQESEDDWSYVSLSDGRSGAVSDFAGPPDESPDCDVCGSEPLADEFDEDGEVLSWANWIQTGDGIRVCSRCVKEFKAAKAGC